MKIIYIVLSLALTTSLYAQDSKIPESKCGDGEMKCPSHSPEKPKPDSSQCKKKCADFNDLLKQKMCIKKCISKPVKPKPDTIKKPKKKVSPELSGCEKTDSQTITCADGVYVKSTAVNDSEIIKEVHENEHKSENNSSESTEQ